MEKERELEVLRANLESERERVSNLKRELEVATANAKLKDQQRDKETEVERKTVARLKLELQDEKARVEELRLIILDNKMATVAPVISFKSERFQFVSDDDFWLFETGKTAACVHLSIRHRMSKSPCGTGIQEHKYVWMMMDIFYHFWAFALLWGIFEVVPSMLREVVSDVTSFGLFPRQ